MKTALILTTINVPSVLALYRKYGPDVKFFVAIERTAKVTDFVIGAEHLWVGYGEDWKCSELIGWQNIQRRNIALLEAVKWGAEIIITIDDDVIPLNKNYFDDFISAFRFHNTPQSYPIQLSEAEQPFNGIKVSSPNGWFDPGPLLTPTIRHRGMPIGIPSTPPELSTITNAKIGVAVGLWVGDADVDATHRIANPPQVHSTTALAETGVVVDPNTKTVWNAQNVGFIRELAPAMFQAPFLGRADDIWASLVTQRIMCEHGLHTHIGKPFTACWQKRSTASVICDLEEELLLYKYTAEFSHWLDDFVFEPGHDSALQQTRDIYARLADVAWYPEKSRVAALAFFDDIEPLL